MKCRQPMQKTICQSFYILVASRISWLLGSHGTVGRINLKAMTAVNCRKLLSAWTVGVQKTYFMKAFTKEWPDARS